MRCVLVKPSSGPFSDFVLIALSASPAFLAPCPVGRIAPELLREGGLTDSLDLLLKFSDGFIKLISEMLEEAVRGRQVRGVKCILDQPVEHCQILGRSYNRM